MNWRAADLHARRPLEVGVQIVEHQHVHPAVEGALVALDIGLDGLIGEQRPIGPLNRDVDQGERRDGLRLPVLEHAKILFRQIGYEPPLLVGDEHIDLDVVHLHLERGRLRRRGLCGLSGAEHDAGQQGEQPRKCDAVFHMR